MKVSHEIIWDYMNSWHMHFEGHLKEPIDQPPASCLLVDACKPGEWSGLKVWGWAVTGDAGAMTQLGSATF